MNILKTSVKSWLKLKKKNTPVLVEKVDPRFYESVANRKVKNDYIQRNNLIMKCVLSRSLFCDDFVVYRPFVKLTTYFIEVLLSL